MNRVSKVVPPKREILKDISLSFFPGAKIGVLGLNSAGKSTLLKIMAGIDTDIQGEARPKRVLRSATSLRNRNLIQQRMFEEMSRKAYPRRLMRLPG